MVSLYLTLMRTAVINQLQYPVAAYLYMIGMVAEPVIYLVVWGTIAEEQGGIGRRLHPGDVRRLLHRVDARAEHQHRLHAVRLGVAHPRG